MNMLNPKISFVTAARNDDYGGNFLGRMNTSFRVLEHLVAKYPGVFELVVVEYNPPSGALPLADVMTIRGSEAFPVRIITVPSEFHTSVAQGKKNPFLEYLAKNIGIRRAHGKFVVSTNPDIVFSEAMIDHFARTDLKPGYFYRANRHDLSVRGFPPDASVPFVLDRCNRLVTRIWLAGDLRYVSLSRWFKRFLNKPRPRNFFLCPWFNPVRNLMRSLKGADRIHDAAAGDFVMAHRDAWAWVRGFDQGPFNSYVDGYNVHMFHCAGFQQEILPFPIYHINHDMVATVGRAMLDVSTYRDATRAMYRTGVPYKIYGENWGFPDVTFVESSV